MNPIPTRRSHPLYVIPVEYARDNEVREALFRDQSIVLDELASGELEIYATSLPDDTYFLIDAGYGDEESNLRDFAQPYTPTPEEVMRALRGPKGDTGPMGMQGDRGESRKCECLEVEDEIANIPLPDPFMTKEKVYNLPPLPNETSLPTEARIPEKRNVVFGYWGRKS